jgi:hypothetical protein
MHGPGILRLESIGPIKIDREEACMHLPANPASPTLRAPADRARPRA